MRKNRFIFPWWVLLLLIAASALALKDIAMFFWSLLPMELFGTSWSAAEYALFSFGRFNVLHTLSMIILEFTAIQLLMVKTFRRDRVQSPWVVLFLSLREKQWLAPLKNQRSMLAENLVQKIVWLLGAFAVVFLSLTSRNPFFVYGGLIVLCVILAILWKSKLLWWNKDTGATEHYLATGAVPFITTTALAWHFGIMSAVIAYLAYSIGLIALMTVAYFKIGPEKPMGESVETATAVKRRRIRLTLLTDNSGSMEEGGKCVHLANSLKWIKKKISESALADLLLIRRLKYSNSVERSERFHHIDMLDTSCRPGGGTATRDAINYCCRIPYEEDVDDIIVLLCDGEDQHSNDSVDSVIKSIADFTSKERGGIIAYMNYGGNPGEPRRYGIKECISVTGSSERELEYLVDELLEGIFGALENASRGIKTVKFFKLA